MNDIFDKPLLIVIGGPTASGKTALAIKIATKLKCDIINADSRQVYQELNIGVAKPSPQELAAVPHHLIGTVSIQDDYNAGIYEKEVMTLLDLYFKKNKVVVLCGGTGMYIKAVLQGLDALNSDNERLSEVRTSLQNQLDTEGLPSMVDLLISLDPTAENTIALQNPARVLRALELIKIHNKPLDEIRTGTKKNRNFNTLLYCLTPERTTLYQNINQRVDKMIEVGLEEEVKNLISFKHYKALQTVGYSELFAYFDGLLDRETAIEKIKQHTRNYAKRQITYFKNTLNAKMVSQEEAESTIFADIKKV